MHFNTKNYLKNTRNHTAKQALHKKREALKLLSIKLHCKRKLN
jgi:hypothetical protein